MLNNRFKKLFKHLKYLLIQKLDKNELTFVNHNKIWRKGKDSRNIILLEKSFIDSSVIAFSYLANILAKKYKAKILAYDLNIPTKKGLIKHLLPKKINKIYRSFQAKSLFAKVNNNQIKKANNWFSEIYPNLKTKKDVENITIEKIKIGDLIYDSYLQEYKKPTLDIKSASFQKILEDALINFIFWRDY